MESRRQAEKLSLDQRAELVRNLMIPEDIFTFKANRENPRRMKLYIKMTKMETEHWDELKKAAKPPHIQDSEFARVLFFRGMNAFMEDLVKRVESLTEEEKAKILEEHDAPAPQGAGVEVIATSTATSEDSNESSSEDK